jgi:hypothetical protein
VETFGTANDNFIKARRLKASGGLAMPAIRARTAVESGCGKVFQFIIRDFAQMIYLSQHCDRLSAFWQRRLSSLHGRIVWIIAKKLGPITATQA